MKILVSCMIIILAIYCNGENKSKTVSLKEISEAKQIIGYLGYPLGTVLKIKGTVNFFLVPDKNQLYPKGGFDKYFVITHVNGNMLHQPVRLEIFGNNEISFTHMETLEALAYERIMTLGSPAEDKKRTVQGRQAESEYHLYKYIDIIKRIK